MDYYEARTRLAAYLPGVNYKELGRAAESMQAESEYASLSSYAKDWSAKRLGFRTGEVMQAEMLSLLDHSRKMAAQGLTGAEREFERQVNHLQNRAVHLWKSAAR